MTTATTGAGDSRRPPFPPGVWKIVAVASMGSFMAQLDSTVVNVALPSIATAVQTTLPRIQWVVSGYLLALALALPLNGWLVDRHGARTVYLTCIATFTLASALCGLAWSAPSLIAFRAIQGIAGGLLAPMAQMLCARAAGPQMARVAGAITVPVLLAPLLGPVVAGTILSVASWHWIFLLNIPFGAAGLGLGCLFLRDEGEERRPRRLDLAGLALLSPALVGFLYGIDHIPGRVGIASLIASAVPGWLFFRRAFRLGDDALIDLRLFRSPVFSGAARAMFFVNGVSFAGQMLVPMWLIHACGVRPEQAGWLMAPVGLGMMCTYPFMGRLTDRFGIRHLAGGGALVGLAGTLLLMVLAWHGLTVGLLAVALVLRGIGTSSIGIPSMSAGYGAVARQDLPMASTALNIVQRLGGPTWSTVCAIALGWGLTPGRILTGAPTQAFTLVFGILAVLHGILFLVTRRLPLRVPAKEAHPAA